MFEGAIISTLTSEPAIAETISEMWYVETNTVGSSESLSSVLRHPARLEKRRTLVAKSACNTRRFMACRKIIHI
jgi:hypothetical protein